jgi:hypothetical protein
LVKIRENVYSEKTKTMAKGTKRENVLLLCGRNGIMEMKKETLRFTKGVLYYGSKNS